MTQASMKSCTVRYPAINTIHFCPAEVFITTEYFPDFKLHDLYALVLNKLVAILCR